MFQYECHKSLFETLINTFFPSKTIYLVGSVISHLPLHLSVPLLLLGILLDTLGLGFLLSTYDALVLIVHLLLHLSIELLTDLVESLLLLVMKLTFLLSAKLHHLPLGCSKNAAFLILFLKY